MHRQHFEKQGEKHNEHKKRTTKQVMNRLVISKGAMNAKWEEEWFSVDMPGVKGMGFHGKRWDVLG